MLPRAKFRARNVKAALARGGNLGQMQLGGLAQLALRGPFCHKAQLGQKFLGRARFGHFAGAQQDDLVCKLDDAFLMRDDHNGAAVARGVDVAERLGQAIEAPQVNARLGLVVNGKFGVARQNGGNLNALHFAA